MKLTMKNLLICIKALEFRIRDSGLEDVERSIPEIKDAWLLIKEAENQGIFDVNKDIHYES
jgi:hypothetical protein